MKAIRSRWEKARCLLWIYFDCCFSSAVCKRRKSLAICRIERRGLCFVAGFRSSRCEMWAISQVSLLKSKWSSVLNGSNAQPDSPNFSWWRWQSQGEWPWRTRPDAMQLWNCRNFVKQFAACLLCKNIELHSRIFPKTYEINILYIYLYIIYICIYSNAETQFHPNGYAMKIRWRMSIKCSEMVNNRWQIKCFSFATERQSSIRTPLNWLLFIFLSSSILSCLLRFVHVSQTKKKNSRWNVELSVHTFGWHIHDVAWWKRTKINKCSCKVSLITSRLEWGK